MTPLHPHAHVAAVGPDLVILQVDRDRYLCLPGAAVLAPPSDDRAALDVADARLLTHLLDNGVLASAPVRARRLPQPLPQRGQPGPLERARPRDLLRLGLATVDLLAGYVGRPLGHVVGYCVARRPTGPRHAAEVVRLAGVFQSLAPWLPMSGKCLVRSFVLRRFLQRSGLDADWVFGVRTWPFSAHCWLQVGDMALDDYAERLDGYTPILVT